MAELRRVYQTKFGTEKAPIAERGNCVQASVASLLGLELDEVPDCSQVPDDGDVNFWTPLEEFLTTRGLGLVWIELGEGKEVGWIAGKPLCLLNVTRKGGSKHTIVGRLWVHDTKVGQKDGTEKSVILGEEVWDPLGGRGNGFAKLDSAIFLVPLEY